MEQRWNELNTIFYYNILLARALSQLLPINDRQSLGFWLDKLTEMGNDVEELEIRNDYVRFILLMLQNDRMLDYFKKFPPTEVLPLKEAISQKIYEEITLATNQNMTWLEELSEDPDYDKTKVVASMPDSFLENQPIPKDGVVCYMATFSDQD